MQLKFTLVLLVVSTLFTSTAFAEGASSSADISKELSNPNTPLATLNFRTTHTSFDGSLPTASDQSSTLTLFQPVFPFPLSKEDKTNFFVRPALPIVWNTPTTTANGTFKDDGGIADIGFDVAVGKTYNNGIVAVTGLQGLIPTKTDISTEQWRLGPELLVAYLTKDYYVAVFPAHQWNLSGPGGYSTTQLEIFAGVYLDNAWTIFTNPKNFYDWKNDQATIPLNLSVRKVTQIKKVPVKFELGVDHFIEKNDRFGQEWAVTLNIVPVVDNFIYSMFK
ncbi:hypothetical protein [Halobacteriovorax sp. HLS]|uniref:hypothetical protein n=1 Tax=Halobacteriovorax sp. HLS TaxID=2234000 RepID=UPI000FD7469C|nr:hypothetical protein [Halobacteriovorax sp. HLS]